MRKRGMRDETRSLRAQKELDSRTRTSIPVLSAAARWGSKGRRECTGAIPCRRGV